jgi:acyl transferase domain-containing protein
MDGALPALREACGALEVSPPKKAKLVSLVTGEEMKTAPGPEHWVRNVRQTVQFYDGLRVITQQGSSEPRVLIEIGPEAVLTAMAHRALSTSSSDDGHVDLVASMTKNRREDESLGLTEAMAAAYAAGLMLNFQVCTLS